MLTALSTLWAFLVLMATQLALRTNAGVDFQARVMGDTSATGTGAYRSATYIGLATSSGVTPAAGDTTMSGEVTAGTLTRAQAVYAHTNGTNTYTLTKTFTSDSSVTVYRIGVFNATSTADSNNTLVFHTTLNATATLVSGDQLQITETVTL